MIWANTGRGKSYFIKNTLRERLKSKGLRCLYLLSRVRTKEQFELELADDDTIRFMTYQALESIKINPISSLGKWDVIIADECHYFLDDAKFNHTTDISFDWLLSQENAIRVFMTATGDGIEEFLNEQRTMYTQYRIHGEYTQVRNLSFFWHESQIATLVQKIIADGEKGAFFIQSAEKAYTLYQQFKNKGLFLCSQYNKDYAGFVDGEKISRMLENESFDCSVLITTLAFDTGVSLKDKSLTNIVIDITDPIKVVQCIGRKRFVDNEDYMNLYIRGRTNQQIGGLMQKAQEDRKIVERFISDGAISYNAANGRRNDTSGLIVDKPEILGDTAVLFSKKINALKHAQLRQEINMYQRILKLGKSGYIKYIAGLLEKTTYSIIEEDLERQSLTQYLDSINGIPLLTVQDRAPLIEHLDVRHNRRLCKSYRVLAAWIESSGLPYRLLEYSTSRMVDGKKKNYKAWKVVYVA